MSTARFDVVTGAYGYSGKYITRRLLDSGHTVRTLTNSLHRANPFGNKIEARPFNFGNQAALIEALRGAADLYNTYWIRFNTKEPGLQHSVAVGNTLKLFEAARQAGVPRIVHTSITNPSEDSPLEYFKGKAVLERALKASGLSYAILRPNVLFGHEDILINNIAWTLRKLPVFGVFGDGQYRLQPKHVDDFAALAVAQGKDLVNRVIDAIGPETFTYRRLVEEIGKIIGVRRPIISVPPAIGYAVGAALGKLVGDVMITRDEVEGLMADLLVTSSPPAGQTKLTEWARQHADTLGTVYASELARRR